MWESWAGCFCEYQKRVCGFFLCACVCVGESRRRGFFSLLSSIFLRLKKEELFFFPCRISRHPSGFAAPHRCCKSCEGSPHTGLGVVLGQTLMFIELLTLLQHDSTHLSFWQPCSGCLCDASLPLFLRKIVQLCKPVNEMCAANVTVMSRF